MRLHLRTRLRSVFPGWWIVASAMSLQATIAGLFLQAFGAYVPFWMAEFGWSRTTISLAYSLHRTESGLLGPLHGWILARVSPRRVVTVGVLLLGGGFIAMAGVQGFTAFLIVFLVQAVGASLCGMLSLMTVLVNWFERRRTTALGLMQTGMSLGGLAVPLVALGLSAYGWRAVSVASGLVVLAIGLPTAARMHRDPAQFGLRPDGALSSEPSDASADSAGSAARKSSPDVSARAAMRTRAFWAMSIGHALSVLVVAAVSVHFVLYAVETLSLGVPLAATLFTLMTLVSIVAQVVGGAMGDAMDKRILAAWGTAGHAAAMVMLAFATTVWLAAIAIMLHGIAWGVRGPLMGAMRADYFGNASFPTVMGFSSMIVMMGSVMGPLIVGLVADTTGDYGFGLLAVGALAGVGVLAFLAMPAPPPRPAAVVKQTPPPR